MKGLGEALEWYGETVKQLRLWRRIVAKYWSSLPPGQVCYGKLFQERVLRPKDRVCIRPSYPIMRRPS